MIYRDEKYGRDLRLSQVEAQQALSLYQFVARTGQGRIIFISGQEGTGKSDILQVLAQTLGQAQPQALIVAGRFRDGMYFSWDIGKEKPFPADEALAASGAGLATAIQASESSLFSTLGQLIAPEIKYIRT